MANSLVSVNKILNQLYLNRYPAEFVRELEALPLEEVGEIMQRIPVKQAMPVWERLSPGICVELIQSLSKQAAVRILNILDPNRGALILNSMDGKERQEYLQAVEPSVRHDLERALSYPPDSAGTLMGTRVDFYTPDMTVRQALDRLRTRKRLNVRVMFLVNEDNLLQGMVQIQDLALARRDTRLQELSRPVQAFVEATASKEEIVDKFEQYRITELPVVDFKGVLLGIVRHHTLINVTKEESSLDIQTMVGVSKEERALSKSSFAVRKRLPWLIVNLATAFLAAMVVGLFESTIAQFTALAVLLPVVAGQSGNTGAQALAVTMRGLALREIWPRQWLTMVMKEFGAGFWNGVAVALTTALGVYIWSRSPGLCLIIGVSMVMSMTIASVSGAIIPILLVKAGQDPAQSSSIFLTTVTDVMGFFSFLGIATLLINLI